MRYGAFRGPRLLTCGLIISATAPGGRFYGAMYREADGPDEMRKAVREQLRAGADFIKVMTPVRGQMRWRIPIPSSSPDRSSARWSMRPTVWVSRSPRTWRGWTAPRQRSGMEWTRSSTACISTSGLTCWNGWRLAVKCSYRRSAATTGWADWKRDRPDHRESSCGDAAQHRRTRPLQPRAGTLSMRAARQAGVRIALGSDAETVSGQDTALELVRMVHHGLSPSEALQSATSVAAEAIGLQDHIGTVQGGKARRPARGRRRRSGGPRTAAGRPPDLARAATRRTRRRD